VLLRGLHFGQHSLRQNVKRQTIKSWLIIHKWSSLISTLFLMMLCVTGLPLIFHDEIETALKGEETIAASGLPSATFGIPLDNIVTKAKKLSGDASAVPLFIGFSQDNSIITVTTGPRPDASEQEMRLFSFDRTTGESIGEVRDDGVMHFLLELHTYMFLGLPGMMFLGVMGILFVLAIVSGLVLYAPFIRRLPFGVLRLQQSKRVARLDEHNLLGVVTLGWALIVGLTGAINAFADPLTDNWRNGELQRMVSAYEGQPALSPARYGSIDRAMALARAQQPGLSPQFIGFPGGAWSSAHHYAIFFQGATPLTSHVLTPALVHAETGKVTDVGKMPVLNQALMLSKPLHFGDYGGLIMKILWAAMTLATIRVLWTGLMLWLRRNAASADRRVDEIIQSASTELVT
jgi:uncharacterized iron-regulated membrane protein